MFGVMGYRLSVVGYACRQAGVSRCRFFSIHNSKPTTQTQLRHLSHVNIEKTTCRQISGNKLIIGCKCFEEEEATGLNSKDKLPVQYVVQFPTAVLLGYCCLRCQVKEVGVLSIR